MISYKRNKKFMPNGNNRVFYKHYPKEKVRKEDNLNTVKLYTNTAN